MPGGFHSFSRSSLSLLSRLILGPSFFPLVLSSIAPRLDGDFLTSPFISSFIHSAASSILDPLILAGSDITTNVSTTLISNSTFPSTLIPDSVLGYTHSIFDPDQQIHHIHETRNHHTINVTDDPKHDETKFEMECLGSALRGHDMRYRRYR